MRRALVLALVAALFLAPPFAAAGPGAEAIGLGWDHVVHGRFDAANERFTWARGAAEQAADADLLVASLLGLAEVARHGPDARPAQRLAEQAAAIVDTLPAARHDAALGGRLAAYDAVMQALVQRTAEESNFDYSGEALRLAERARARALNDALEAAGRPARLGNVPGIKDAQSLLAPDEALLYFATGDSASWAWIVRNDRWTHRRLPTRRVLAADVRAVLADLSSAAKAGTPAAVDRSRRLFRALLPGLGEMLAGVKRLRVAADGDLALLPFEALVTEMPAAGQRPSYVVGKYDVSYTPSVMRMTTPPSLFSQPLAIVVGDASPALVRLLGADRVRSAGGAGARWSAIGALGKARLVHVGAMGPLEVADILPVPLAARLVTLAGGSGDPGALLEAGAESVVQRLWKVDSIGAARLLDGFYRRLLKEGLPRNAALAGAKREMLKGAAAATRSPHTWAAFVLVGATGPVAF